MGGRGYSVAFDPLDGSSIIDSNFAVGTIWGTWPGNKLTGNSVQVCFFSAFIDG
jgi:sedoheptulose-bisphosphatase